MKRTEAIQALRERFSETKADGITIQREEAAALGVFEDQDDGCWVSCLGHKQPVDDEVEVDVVCGDLIVSIEAGSVNWSHADFYRPHRED